MLEELNLTQEESLKKVKEQVEFFKLNQNSDLIFKFLLKLKDKLSKLGPEQEGLKEKYQNLVVQLEWMSADMLLETDVKRLLEKDFNLVLNWDDLDLKRVFDLYMISQVPLLFRDRRKKDFLDALKQNQEKITDKDLEDKNGKMVSPTIANWLKEYDLMVGSKVADKLKKTEFLYQTKNTRQILEVEREKLVKLIDFYEYLKVTSEHPAGIEDKFTMIDKDVLVEVDHGELVELGPLPEVEAKENIPGKIYVRHPQIKDILNEEEKEVPSHLETPVVKSKPKPMIVAPTLKEAEAVMQKPKVQRPKAKPEPKLEIPEPIPVPKPKPVPKPQIKKPMPPIQPQKQIITDVKAPQKVLSLTDELEQMSVDEFRKLGADKIREKIDLLEQDSMEKRAEGIEAWKKSPVNSLYLEIGQDSFMQGKGVREIIKSREENGQPVLTYAEFEDLADLNKSLRF